MYECILYMAKIIGVAFVGQLCAFWANNHNTGYTSRDGQYVKYECLRYLF